MALSEMKNKRLKQKESQLAIFKFHLYSLSQVFNDIMTTKRSKGYMHIFIHE